MEKPLAELTAHLNEAKNHLDPMGRFGCLSTIDEHKHPSSRIVTIREVDQEGLSFFINQDSPKASHLKENGKYELLLFWPTIKIQYRIRGTFSLLRNQSLKDQWQKRPTRSKLADIYHSKKRQQSTAAPTYDTIKREFLELKKEQSADQDLPFPDTVVRLLLRPDYVEQWIESPEDWIHRRTLYLLTDKKWMITPLVP